MTDVESMVRGAYPRALATLIRVLGGLDPASDALHTAVERALVRWAEDPPRNPVAWLIRTARNAAIDGARRREVERRYAPTLAAEAVRPAEPPELAEDGRNDMLRLIFTCCHPALTPDSQVALTLRTVVGLTVEEIAQAYLVEPKAMERRLTRARNTLRKANLPYQVPDATELPARLEAVTAVIVALFNEGYSYAGEEPRLRPRLCELAIRLGRMLARMFPADPEVGGMLALMLLQHARFAARTADPGGFVSLEDQDRTLWDQALIREGRALMERAIRGGALGPYQLQGAIAATHCAADTWEATRWDEIVVLYDLLVERRPSPITQLNRSVAVAKARGPSTGLLALEGIEGLDDHHLFHAARGHMLRELGESGPALEAFQRSLTLATHPVERAHLLREMETLRRDPEKLH